MVKPIWLAAAFVAGIAVGIVATRMFAEAPAGEAQASNAPAVTSRTATRDTGFDACRAKRPRSPGARPAASAPMPQRR